MTGWNDLISSIGSVGFPIIMCYLMWTFITDTVSKFTETMRQNTQMIEKLCEKIDKDEKKSDNKKTKSPPP